MKKYLTQSEIHEIECAIYNDDNKTLFESLPQSQIETVSQETIKELAEGQPYTFIPDTMLILRKDGRLLNIKYVRPVKPQFTPKNLIVAIRGKQLKYSEVYEKEGWPFDNLEIVKRYKENGWGISVQKFMRDAFEEL